MISSNNLQFAYVDLYIQIRKYIWGFDTVKSLADLEVATYQTFPNVHEIQSCFHKLHADLKDVAREDEDMQAAINDFIEVLDTAGDDSVYAKLVKVREVIQQ